ncbi:hypothetical protein [Enterocloster sp.]
MAQGASGKNSKKADPISCQGDQYMEGRTWRRGLHGPGSGLQ